MSWRLCLGCHCVLHVCSASELTHTSFDGQSVAVDVYTDVDASRSRCQSRQPLNPPAPCSVMQVVHRLTILPIAYGHLRCNKQLYPDSISATLTRYYKLSTTGRSLQAACAKIINSCGFNVSLWCHLFCCASGKHLSFVKVVAEMLLIVTRHSTTLPKPA